MKVDDVVDAIPVHFACGMWGVFSASLFATKDNCERMLSFFLFFGRARHATRSDNVMSSERKRPVRIFIFPMKLSAADQYRHRQCDIHVDFFLFYNVKRLVSINVFPLLVALCPLATPIISRCDAFLTVAVTGGGAYCLLATLINPLATVLLYDTFFHCFGSYSNRSGAYCLLIKVAHILHFATPINARK